MALEQDPALSPEASDSDQETDTTVVDPPTTEETAEKPEESSEETETSVPQKDQKAPEKAPFAEVEIHVDGVEPTPVPKDSAAWARLRKQESELRRQNAELERRLAVQAQPQQAVDPGPKPTLESCDFDSAVFETRLEGWHDKRRQKEAADAQAQRDAVQQQQAWQSRLGTYNQKKEELSKQIPDYADHEATVAGMLDQNQQGVILKYADNPALVIAALGRNPELVQDFASTKDLGSLIAKIAKLEVRTSLKKKTQAPPPEKPVRGTGAVSGAVDSQLERLRAAAEKTGDYSKVVEYNRTKRTQK